MNEIGIFYSSSQAEMGAFWYYFFQLCGIWCIKHVIDSPEEWNILGHLDTNLNLGIFDENMFINEAQRKCENIYFCTDFLSNAVNNELIIKRAKQVLRGLCKSQNESSENLEPLVDLYVMKDLRFYLWGYQEILWANKVDVKILLDNKIKKALDSLRSCGKKHEEYARIYLNYIILRLRDSVYFRNGEEAQNLLKECKTIMETHPDFFCTYILAGKICDLSESDEAFSALYYQEALKFCQDSWLLYFVGRALEHKERSSSEDVYKYYEEAYRKIPKIIGHFLN